MCDNSIDHDPNFTPPRPRGSPVQFRLDNGGLALVYFCSIHCAYQGGLAHARAMTTTCLTIGQLQVVFGKHVEYDR
jgi:hypothetical protein